MSDAATSADLVSRVNANFMEAFRHLARLAERGAVEEEDGLVLIASGAPFGEFNPTFATRPLADPARGIERARAFYEKRGLPWVLRAIGDGAAETLAPVTAQAGLQPAHTVPGMLLTPIVGTQTDVPGLTIRTVEDAAHLSTFVGIMAEGFEIPRDWLRVLDTPRALEIPDLAFYLGYVDGHPVTTAMRITSHRIAGVYSISTIPAYRRRGLGEAMTWWATLGGRDEGCLGACLQASEMGQPLYRRMGYRTVAEYRSWEPAGS